MSTQTRNPDGASPAMAQWFALKAQHPDALLFFRMGDFFELFFDDAEAAAAALDIALTSRGEHAGQKIAMCGVPVAAAEVTLARLIRRGFRVAIAEQMEAPSARTGKAPLRREIVRLVTPGTVTEEALLEASRPSLLLALAPVGDRLGAAWCDITTGLFETEALETVGLPALLGRLDPAEILAGGLELPPEWQGRATAGPALAAPMAARRRLAEAFEVASLDAFGEFGDAEAVAALAALDYVRMTQAGRVPRLARPFAAGRAGRLAMDAATRASLDLVRGRDGGTAHTLLSAVDRTLTGAGARCLAEWIASPLAEAEEIAARQDGWAWLAGATEAATGLRRALKGSPDLARALGRVALGRFLPRDLASIRAGLAAAREARTALSGDTLPPRLAAAVGALAGPPALEARLAAALAPALPARLEDGGTIAAGFDGELDAERALRDDSRRVVSAMQLDLAQSLGVASLKIRHHQQLGYVIEVPAAAVERLRARPELILRQGMANGARFTHPELSALDRRIAEAAERAAARERRVLAALVSEIVAEDAAIGAAAEALALLDVLQGAATLAATGRWCRPAIEAGTAFCVRAGRHPVVEAALAGGEAFVPNDCDLSPDRRVLLLTGPNMAGKSTFLRQNALLVVLAQAGLPAPAAEFRLGIVDRLFSRVGAADELARGRSTFMVEMTETAAILNQAGPRSLVVVDEVGRGTATLDGLAIAWAVLEALHGQVRSRTLFATHFHELAQLQPMLPALRPHTMRVREWRGGVVFLHEVAEGAAGRSWGVHVARLAGVPAAVVARAAALLARLEAGRGPAIAELPLFAGLPAEASAAEPPALAVLREIDPDTLSPREALALIYRLRGTLGETTNAAHARS